MSLKSDRVNVRRGPGPEHAIEWVFRRAGLPLEVMAEADVWRRVRDSEGSTGWVLASLLSNRRTALVEPWEVKGGAARTQVAIRADDSESSKVVAQVEAGVIANVMSCDGRWCLVTIPPFRGYVPQSRLWGVYKGETIR
jgi:SH3-like domain-containing protein